MISSATGFTPADASKPENIDKAHMNMQTKAKLRKRPYENIKVGDKVRLFRKRKHLNEKESVPVWSRVAYEVVKIDDNEDAGKLYYLSNRPTIPTLRSQILLVT